MPPTNALGNLASDIQAMLIQARGAASPAQTSTAATASAVGTPVSPEQKLVADLGTLMTDLQSAGAPNARTANVNPADTNGRTEHHHHHGEANGSNAVARATGATGQSAASTDQAVSRIFAAGIAQALKAYGGMSAVSAMHVATT